MHLVFFLEGQSEKAMLEILIPKILIHSNITIQYITFEGKQDLIKQLPIKLKGWSFSNTKFVILLDKDQDDCKKLKEKLITICKQNTQLNNTLIRIACEELESWYFGDLDAVEKGLDIKKLKNQSTYRIPDNIKKPAKELEKITKNQYQKIKGSRSIAEYLDLKQNSSQSYRVFITGIQKIAEEG